MKAIQFEKTGDPAEVLRLADIEIPEPKDNEVRIKVWGSTVNPADELFINGRYRYKPVFPQTAGLEGAGVIDKPGNNVDLPTGSAAAFLHLNAWAEYIIVPKNELFLIPDNFQFEKAVQFALNPFTAYGLLERSGLNEGDWLLLTAGNSAVSKIIIQLAAYRKINVICIVRGAGHEDKLKQLGAAGVVNSASENITERVNEITQGKGADCALDAVGGKTGTEIINSLKTGAKLIIYGMLSKEPSQYYNSAFVYKNISVTGFGIRGFLESMQQVKKDEAVKSLAEIIGREDFLLDTEESFPIEKFKEAFKAYYSPDRKGKIIFKIKASD